MCAHLLARQLPDLVEQVDGWRQAAVHAKDLILNQRCERHVVKEVGENLPHVGVAVLAQALVVKAVDLRDLPRLVVAAQQEDAVAVPHLERDQQRHRLDRVIATVDVVAHEEVIGVGARAANAEDFHEVVKLGVDVAADDHRRGHCQHV